MKIIDTIQGILSSIVGCLGIYMALCDRFDHHDTQGAIFWLLLAVTPSILHAANKFIRIN